MKKSRLISISLVALVLIVLLQFSAAPVFAETATPEFFAHRILSRSTVLQIDGAVAYAFNERTDLSDSKPYYEDDTAMVPVRFIAESFNAECGWESSEGGTFIVEQRNCAVIRISEGKPMTADTVVIESDALPVNKNGKLYVPAESFAKAMRLEYKEDKATGLIFFSRWDESERHSNVDYEKHLLPYFDEKYLNNEETYLFVSTTGNDKTGDGTEGNPFKTIERAKEAVRELTKDQKGDIIVYIRGGIYYVDEAITFTEADSGKNGYKVKYMAYKDEQPVFDGSRVVKNWRLYKGNIYVADVEGEEPIHALYENGTTTLKARHPNANPNEPRDGFMKTLGDSEGQKQSLSWNKGEVPYVENTKDLEVFVWPGGSGGIWMWHSQIIPVTSFDNENNMLRLERKGIYDLGKGSKFYMMGALEFLDQAGEFYHDTEAGKLYYIPTDYSMTNKQITIPAADNIFHFIGASMTDTVQNIEISGLEIRNTERSTNVAYCIGVYMSKTTGNGVKLENTENCAVRDCHIHDVGGNGVFSANYNSNMKICGNYVHNTALGAIYLKFNGVFLGSNNLVYNNLVHTTSRLVGQTQAIQLEGGGDNFARHNRVDDAIRAGLQLADGRNGHSYAGYNDLSDCNASSEDTGMIYTANQMQGTGSTVNNNFMHDSNAGYSYWSAMYSDIVCDSMRTQNNIVTRMGTEGHDDRGTYLSSYFAKGRNYKLINNIAAHSGVDPNQGSFHMYDSTGTTSEGYIIERNIAYNHGPNVYDAPHLTEKTVERADKNVFYTEGVEEYTLSHTSVRTYEEWKQYGDGTMDQNSITEDPKFMNSVNDDFRLRYDSPAKALGIKTIKQSTIGLTDDFKYVDENEPIWRIFISREGYSDTLSAMNLQSGQQAKLKVTGKTYSSFVKQPSNITYTSDAPHIAYVDSNGVVTAVSPGKAKITATVEDKGVVSSIDLYAFVDDELTELKFDQEFYILRTNEMSKLMLVGKTKFGQILVDDEFDNVNFSLSNNESATIDSGANICFTKVGGTDVTATAFFNGKPLTAIASVSATDIFIKNVKLVIESNSVEEGAEIKCHIIGYGADGVEIPVDAYEISVESMDTAKAQISNRSGSYATVKGVASGKVQIKATVNWLGKQLTATSNLMVTSPSSFKNNWKISNYQNSAGYAIEDDNGINIYSSGEDIYYAQDEFTFVSREVSGENITIEATVKDVESAPTSIASTGIMLRQEDTADSYNVNIRYLPGSKSVMVTWRTPEAPKSKDISVARAISKEFAYSDPIKLKLEKKGDVITAYCMDASGKWNMVTEVPLTFNGKFMAGATVFSGDPENVQWFNGRIEDIKIY